MATQAPKRTINRVAPREAPPKEDRDPNSIHDYIKVDFYSVLAEPTTGPQSLDCTWECSEIFFSCCLDCGYKLMSLFCGVCMAVYWAFQFAPVIFTNVWIFTPIRQLLNIVLGFWYKTCVYFCARCCVAPWTKSCALLFVHCGDGTNLNRPETPPLFPSHPRRKPPPKPVVKEEPKHLPTVAAPVNQAGGFDDYDKDKIARSVKRTLMLY